MMKDKGKNRNDGDISNQEGCGKAKRSQALKDDETNTEDLVGTSNYERAEADQSKGIFAEQTAAYNKAMEEMLKKKPEK